PTFALLWPRVRGLWNQWVRATRAQRLTSTLFLLFGLGFWVGIFALMLWLVDAFYTVEVFGPILAQKLLQLLLVSIFGLLCFSNIVTALSTFYLSDDLELIRSLPVDRAHFHLARKLDTLAQSSWMIIAFGLPVFVAYGVTYGAGWIYYGLLVLLLPAFVWIPGAVGVAMASVLVTVFPARRVREALVVLGVFVLVGVFVLIRVVRPERLVDAQSFESVAAYVAELQAPVPLLVPSRWLSDVLLAALQGRPIPWVEAALLLTGALAVGGIARWITAWLYDQGHARAQEARQARLAKSPLLDGLLDRLTRILPDQARAVVIKDVKTFVRDPGQWSQLFLLASIVAIALLSVAALPLDSFRGPWLGTFRNALAFLVLGLVGFVMAAVAARFQFTAVSGE
ncbi:MAG: hypothetical protein QGG40_21700, partial [Myxococcota bacterium]|nr:hypothetical protein [Myxococcota bacterium]